ncbi:MAG: hypothetical protein CVU88_03630 [Firmicutes bacterium HGW-Firmicutes-13]|nr:MAG: hypothetical protein CVU88_03630 [Firmicutes bacterium HGW-Firmicutes-13]
MVNILNMLIDLTNIKDAGEEYPLLVELEKLFEQLSEKNHSLSSLYALLGKIPRDKIVEPVSVENLSSLIPGQAREVEGDFQKIEALLARLKAFVQNNGRSPEGGDFKGEGRGVIKESFQQNAAVVLKESSQQDAGLLKEQPFMVQIEEVSGSIQEINENKSLTESVFLGKVENSSPSSKHMDSVQIQEADSSPETGVKITKIEEGFVNHSAVIDFSETLSHEVLKDSPVDPSLSFKEDVLSQLIEKLELIQLPGRMEMKVQLKPEHLGEITILLAMEKGTLKARLMVENLQVKGVLESGLTQIKSQLESQNFKAAEVSVTVNQEGSFYFQENSGFGSFPRGKSSFPYPTLSKETGFLPQEEEYTLSRGRVNYLA